MSSTAVAPVGVRRIWPFAPFVVIALVHLVQLALLLGTTTFATKVLLMPALLVGLLLVARRRLSASIVLTSLGLVASWAGDILFAAPGGNGFVLGLASFLVAHVLYAIALLGPLRARPRIVAVVVLAVWAVGLLAVLLPHTGALAAPVILYALALAVVAAAASGIGRIAALGGILFMASDSVLALTLFVPDFTFWRQDAAIMTLYCAAQLLLVVGIARRAAQGRLAASA